MTPKRLREIRRGLGWTQGQLAAEIGVSSARTVRRWELGERKVPEAVARLLRLMLNGEFMRRRDLS